MEPEPRNDRAAGRRVSLERAQAELDAQNVRHVERAAGSAEGAEDAASTPRTAEGDPANVRAAPETPWGGVPCVVIAAVNIANLSLVRATAHEGAGDVNAIGVVAGASPSS